MSIKSDMFDLINESVNKGTSAYESQAKVVRVDGDTLWVHIAGGVDETPVKRTINARVGDTVQVRVSGGRAYVQGNETNPPTDDRTANIAKTTATSADKRATKALETAESFEKDIDNLGQRVADANERVDGVVEEIDVLDGKVDDAETAVTNLNTRVGNAESSITTVEGNITNLQGRVTDAEDDIDDTLAGLALAQNVIGTLQWITAHSTVTTDTTPQAGTTYYIKNQDGTFEVVTDTTGKNPAQEGWYVMDESVQNYIASHIALTQDGLVVTKDNTKWKVLIKDDGVYIVDNTSGLNKVVAKYKDVITLGKDDGSESYQKIDYHSLQLIDKEGYTYFHVSDLRNSDGEYELTNTFIGDGAKIGFNLNPPSKDTNYTVTVDGTEVTSGITKTKEMVFFTTAPTKNAVIVVAYTTKDYKTKAYTAGIRLLNSVAGIMSFAEGLNITASGSNSHAEGVRTTASNDATHAEGSGTTASGYISHAEGVVTTASGSASHAEGLDTIASGLCSHAQGNDTIASKDYQTAIGQYNIEDTETIVAKQKAFIVGNGTSDNNRSNAFDVDWGGNTKASGDITDGTGNVLSDKVDDSALAPVATSGSYNDLSDKPTIPTASQQVWYGTCSTTGSTATKVVTTTTGDFEFSAGNVLYVRFTNANTATGNISVTVDGTNKAVYFGNGQTAPRYWSALETLALVYNGTSFYAVNQGIATTLHYGATMLENSVTSTSTSTSATPDSVRRAYEKAQDAMDAIPEIGKGRTGSISVTANSYKDATVTFDTEFTAVPNVVVSIYSTSTAGAIGSLTASALDVTTTGFKVRVFNAGSASRSPAVDWIAIN